MASNRSVNLDRLMSDDPMTGDLLNDEEKLDLHISSFYSQLESEVEISTALKEVTQRLPKDYLDSMRRVAEKLKEDEWFYPSVNKLLGLQ